MIVHTVRLRLPAKAEEKGKEKKNSMRAVQTDFHKINMIVYNNIPDITFFPINIYNLTRIKSYFCDYVNHHF